jgi:hypothetical protein
LRRATGGTGKARHVVAFDLIEIERVADRVEDSVGGS